MAAVMPKKTYIRLKTIGEIAEVNLEWERNETADYDKTVAEDGRQWDL